MTCGAEAAPGAMGGSSSLLPQEALGEYQVGGMPRRGGGAEGKDHRVEVGTEG